MKKGLWVFGLFVLFTVGILPAMLGDIWNVTTASFGVFAVMLALLVVIVMCLLSVKESISRRRWGHGRPVRPGLFSLTGNPRHRRRR